MNNFLIQFIDCYGNYREYEVEACNSLEAEILCREAHDVDIIVCIHEYKS